MLPGTLKERILGSIWPPCVGCTSGIWGTDWAAVGAAEWRSRAKKHGAERWWAWQYVFPSERLSIDPRSGRRGPPPVSESRYRRPSLGQCAGGCSRDGRLPTRSGTPSPRTCWRRIRHPHCAGAARPRRRAHYDDLHAHAQPRRMRRTHGRWTRDEQRASRSGIVPRDRTLRRRRYPRRPVASQHLGGGVGACAPPAASPARARGG
jgi:hypothetical protein